MPRKLAKPVKKICGDFKGTKICLTKKQLEKATVKPKKKA